MKQLLTIFSILASLSASAQSYSWALKAGSTGADYGYGITCDSHKDVIITGRFNSSISFGTHNLSSAGSDDIFIVKYDPAGNVSWAKKAGGSGSDYGFAVTTDVADNIYITGWFQGTASFGSTNVISAGGNDIFIAKYNTAGDLQWVKSTGGTSDDEGQKIDLDPNGNIYLTGHFKSNFNFFGGTAVTSAGSWDAFVARLDTSGNTVSWVKTFGSTGYDVSRSLEINGNHIFLAGSVSNTVVWNSSITTNSNGMEDAFIAKMDLSGTVLWVKTYGGSLTDYGHSVSVDPAGNPVLTGRFMSSASFGSSNFSSFGDADVFIVGLDGSTGSQNWATQAGGLGPDEPYCVKATGTGRWMLVGTFTETASFGSINKIEAGYADVFISELNNNGTFNWVTIGGSTGYDQATAVSIDHSGNAYVTGTYYKAATFGSATLPLTGYSDFYLTKVAYSYGVGISDIVSSNASFQVYPNPSGGEFRIRQTGNEVSDILIYSSDGKIVKSIKDSQAKDLYIADLSEGVYFINLRNKDMNSTQKLVIVR